ncbi:hypothetical protein P8452_41508 [Trifolium repens]|nr:hypothetical protein P8452_41508 [Trifolium repens]
MGCCCLRDGDREILLVDVEAIRIGIGMKWQCSNLPLLLTDLHSNYQIVTARYLRILLKVNIITKYPSLFNLKQVEESIKGWKNTSYHSQFPTPAASSVVPASAAESASATAPASTAPPNLHLCHTEKWQRSNLPLLLTDHHSNSQILTKKITTQSPLPGTYGLYRVMSKSIDEVIMIPPEKKPRHDNEENQDRLSLKPPPIPDGIIDFLRQNSPSTEVNIITKYPSRFNLKQVEESIKGEKNTSYHSQFATPTASSALPASAAESASATAPASNAPPNLHLCHTEKMTTNIDNDDSTLWPDLVTKAFIDIMVDEVTKGNMTNGMWNAETNTVTASEEVWQNYLKAHDKASQFQKKGCDHYKLLEIIFNKNNGTEVLHYSSIQNQPNTNIENELNNQHLNTESTNNACVDNDSSGNDIQVECIIRRGKQEIQVKYHTPRTESTSNRMGDALVARAKIVEASSSHRPRFPKGKKGKPLNAIDEKVIVEENVNGLSNPVVAAKERMKCRNQITVELLSEEISNNISAAYFDASKNFVEYVRYNEIKDAWLDNVEIDPRYDRSSFASTKDEYEVQEFSSKDVAIMKRRIANVFEPEETILHCLRRLKGSGNRKAKMFGESYAIVKSILDHGYFIRADDEIWAEYIKNIISY